MSTSKPDGVGGARETEEGEEGDGLLASLADELVWKGSDEEEGEEEEDEDGLGLEGLDASELESLGISMLVSSTCCCRAVLAVSCRGEDSNLYVIIENGCLPCLPMELTKFKLLVLFQKLVAS